MWGWRLVESKQTERTNTDNHIRNGTEIPDREKAEMGEIFISRKEINHDHDNNSTVPTVDVLNKWGE